jgi:voltage-dependent potassium channel beta subunit
MRYRRMGKTGLKLSELSLGSWITFGGQIDAEQTKACMHAAWDAGVNFFDGAESYGRGEAERVMGSVISAAGWRRESLVLSTKIFWGGDGPNEKGLSHKRVIEGVNNALLRWKTDHLDLAYCHRPDPDTPIEETVRAFDLLVRQGKILYWGTSEWSAADILEALRIAHEQRLFGPTVEQPQYNLLVRERVESEYAPLWEIGYGATVWSPLASGLLSGKYKNGTPPPDSRLGAAQFSWLREMIISPQSLQRVDALAPVAADLGCTLAMLAIAWCLKNPNLSSVITGASRPSQVVENLKSLDVADQLSPDVMGWIDRILIDAANPPAQLENESP